MLACESHRSQDRNLSKDQISQSNMNSPQQKYSIWSIASSYNNFVSCVHHKMTGWQYCFLLDAFQNAETFETLVFWKPKVLETFRLWKRCLPKLMHLLGKGQPTEKKKPPKWSKLIPLLLNQKKKRSFSVYCPIETFGGSHVQQLSNVKVSDPVLTLISSTGTPPLLKLNFRKLSGNI